MIEMHCDEFVELVTEFLENAMTAEQEERFVAHLAYCDWCGAYLDQLRDTIRGLAAQPAPGLSPSAKQALLAEFRSRPASAGD